MLGNFQFRHQAETFIFTQLFGSKVTIKLNCFPSRVHHVAVRIPPIQNTLLHQMSWWFSITFLTLVLLTKSPSNLATLSFLPKADTENLFCNGECATFGYDRCDAEGGCVSHRQTCNGTCLGWVGYRVGQKMGVIWSDIIGTPYRYESTKLAPESVTGWFHRLGTENAADMVKYYWDLNRIGARNATDEVKSHWSTL